MSSVIAVLFVGFLSIAILGLAVTGGKARSVQNRDSVIAEYGAPLKVLSVFVMALLASLIGYPVASYLLTSCADGPDSTSADKESNHPLHQPFGHCLPALPLRSAIVKRW